MRALALLSLLGGGGKKRRGFRAELTTVKITAINA